MTFLKMVIMLGGFTLLVFLFLSFFTKQDSVLNPHAVNRNTEKINTTLQEGEKTCKMATDCVLLICTGGCVNKDYAKKLPPQPPCMTYQSYQCECENGTCTMKPPRR